MLSIIFTLIWTVIGFCMVMGIIGVVVSSMDKAPAPVVSSSALDAYAADQPTVIAPAPVFQTSEEMRLAAIAKLRAQWR